MARILIKSGRVRDEGFSLTDKVRNHNKSDKGYRCVLTISDGQVVYRK